MSESRRSLVNRLHACLRHWWGVVTEIVAAVKNILTAKPSYFEVVAAELIIACVLAVVLLLAVRCWVFGALNCAYEYDEVTRAHWVWLTHQGLRPFHDFFENHPPYQYLLLPVAAAWDDPGQQLTVYRVINGLSIPFLLLGLAANAITPQRHRLRYHSFWGMAVVCSHPYVMRFLIEFRLDSWAYTVIVWSIYWWRRQVDAISNNLVLGFCTSIAAFWLCPKLVLLPPMLVIAAQVTRNWQWRSVLRSVGGYFIGTIAALIVFLLFVWLWRLHPQRVFDLVVRYNWDANKFTSETGVLEAIRNIRPLFTWIVIATVCIVLVTFWRRDLLDPFYIALMSFLVLHALLVRYPYKQFVAPWFLLGSLLLSYAVHRMYETQRRMTLIGIVAIVCCTSWVSASSSIQTGTMWRADKTAAIERDILRQLNRITSPDDRVACAPPLHPITRFDAFYVSCNSYDAQRRDTEFLLERQRALAELVTDERYYSELNDYPPAIVVLDGLYPARQRRVLHRFVADSGYVTEYVCGRKVLVRPDRAGQLESRSISSR
jgi:hypothetical protein